MGARGPRPETPEIQALKGNPGKRKKRAPSIRPNGDVYIPNYLDDDARECFEMIVSAMPPSTYSATDAGGIAVYAAAWADHKRATEALKTLPALVPGSTGNLSVNPWFKIKNEAARIMMAMGDRLGLDPKSRAGLVTPEEKPKSKFAGLIGQSAVKA
ncbi:phage terminase small subunit P27 family [Ochrobactrum sp. MYb15]|uniref:P27 family phage terminase small subunit n=1 Tax=Brucella pituitosa TaxID=571256 RepID=UPI000CFACAB4|nr:phage terminase small subunit P27 family [Ochrobactrum sp. MYb19]PRA46658.1 phage terminase small subunit P27 family [Ochrobactrum sp. MYb68]PRA68660.1 phage terminase small subunit P27 family [Ochrobactrum sp. MYb18]PRA74112.1 phage terminase small subunit P27 family [Brucella thiophenivorans]PRA90912.1 phage terminase small subunit P27 family [Ochrobactrum sp. MYb14]PRA96363.1 phage terminase small subunit P27 family [Ochrobactrum sp. MYb15]